MSTRLESFTFGLEKAVLCFFSPNGLKYVLVLIVLGALLFGGSGIENRMMDGPAANSFHATASPLLASVK